MGAKLGRPFTGTPGAGGIEPIGTIGGLGTLILLTGHNSLIPGGILGEGEIGSIIAMSLKVIGTGQTKIHRDLIIILRDQDKNRKGKMLII